ncbi:hypothetical protein ACFVZX_42545, partial [Streptomyces erythrochromogenes]
MKRTPAPVTDAGTVRPGPRPRLRPRSVRPLVAAAAALGALLLAGCGGQNAVKPPAPQGQAGVPGAAAPRARGPPRGSGGAAPGAGPPRVWGGGAGA